MTVISLSCAVCFQPGHIWSEATGWAILVMLFVLLPVFGGVIAFFVTIARRAKAAAAGELGLMSEASSASSSISHENS